VKVARLYPPPEVLKIVSVLERAGFEAWCVGGAVRDSLLGIKHLDWDIATSATPPQVRKLFKRTVPIGIDFGTIGVLDAQGFMHEVTTFRRDVRTDGRHAEVEFGATLEEDLARRDFTINAIAYAPSTDELRDPFGGQDDLGAHLIRAVGVPDDRMREDRLRALRAIRFAARFDFRIEPQTWQAIVESEPHLSRLSPERVKQEIEKTMEQVVRPSVAFSMWRDAGIFRALVPPLRDVDDTVLLATDHLCRPGPAGRPQRLVNRIAVLFTDLSQTELSATLKALRFSNAEAAWIGALVDRWARLQVDFRRELAGGNPPDSTIRRWVAVSGRTRFASLMRVAAARWAAEAAHGRDSPDVGIIRSVYRRALRIAYRDPVELSDLAVDGNDVRSIGVAGPAVGRILQQLLDAVLEQPSHNEPAYLMELARRAAAEGAVKESR
jgi:tRNA nucleotidyltransferase (CCA-adding enzyme)